MLYARDALLSTVRACVAWAMVALATAGTGSGAVRAADEAPAGPAARHPEPDPAGLQQGKAAVFAEFQKDFASVRLASTRIDLAHQFYEEALKTDHDVNKAYALLRYAKDGAIEASDADFLSHVLEAYIKRFDVDGPAVRHQALDMAARGLTAANTTHLFSEGCRRAMDLAVEANDYAAAVEYGRAALAAARKSGDDELVTKISQRGRQIVAIRQQYEGYVAAQAVLVASPKDPDANLIVGRFLCLAKNDWLKGLINLRRGSDADLKDAAQKEIALLLRKEGEPLTVADTWWRLAEGRPEPDRRSMMDRAAYWYLKALPELTGFQRKKVELKLEQVRNYKEAGPGGEKPAAARPAKPAKGAGKAARGQGPDVAAGQWVDLLAQLDATKDAAAGQWKVLPGGLAAQPANGQAKLIIPLAPEGDYDLEIKFTRTEGDAMVGVILPVGGRQVLAAFSHGGVSGLDMIAGERAGKNPSTFQGALNNGRPYTLAVSVRLDGGQVRLTAEIDGRTWLFYNGATSVLALNDQWKSGKRAGLGLAAQSPVLFQAVKLREVRATR